MEVEKIMEKTVRFDGNLDMFKNIVLLYKDENGDTYLGSSSHNVIGDKDHQNFVVLYKDCLPKDQDYISGWNYLDENSNNIYIVYNPYSEVAVDDFLYAHNTDKSWKDIDYTVVNSTSEINKSIAGAKLKNNEIRAYATLA